MQDNDRKMEVVQQLMDELQEIMKPSSEDLGDRLGRPKQVDVMKISAGGMPGMDDDQDPMQGKDPDDDSDQDGEMEPDEDDMGSPDEMLKRRLMKLRE